MHSSPFFSVIVPVYNVEKYVADCVRSILSQTLPDFELIIINDGSTDKSIEVIRAAVNNDPRVLIITQSNKGLSAARNTGMANARGQFVFFLDSDDYIATDSLAVLYSVIEKNDNIELVAFSAHSFLDGDDNRKDVLETYKQFYARTYLQEGLYSGVEYYRIMAGKENFVASACMYVTKLSLIKQHRLSFVEGLIHEDEVFSRQLFHCIQTMYYLPANLYYRRIVEQSITQRKVSNQKIYSLIIVAEKIYDLFRSYRDDQLRKDAIEHYHWAMINFLKHFPDNQKLANRFLFSSLFFFSNYKRKIVRHRFPRLYSYYSFFKTKLPARLS